VSENLFPSGPWVGFYHYSPSDKHRMELDLTFANGRLSGAGTDDVGPFLIKGGYDSNSLECSWIKTYPGSHAVFYRGFREGKGIWGAWDIGPTSRGGFHIWPRQPGDGEEQTASAKREQPIEAIGDEIALRRVGDQL